jgi:osmotically-inducible protein OsmY
LHDHSPFNEAIIMTTATLAPTDVLLRNAVARHLDWDPDVDASAIGVAAKDGIVTLTGYIDSSAGKLQAERVAKRIAGVRAVANDLIVRQLVDRTDADIAREAAEALEVTPAIAEKVQAAVHQGHVTLTGTVPWVFQKRQAEKAVRRVRGVRSVLNTLPSRRAPAHVTFAAGSCGRCTVLRIWTPDKSGSRLPMVWSL